MQNWAEQESGLMAMNALSASLEDYLEAIFHLISEKKVARVKDISKRLKVNYSSVTGALHSLAKSKLVNYTPYESITLTPRGKSIARDVIKRHEALRDFLTKVLLVDDELADETACKMEHAITGEVIKRFVHFMEFVEKCPRSGADWLKGFENYCSNTCYSTRECKLCLSLCLEEVKRKEAVENIISGDSEA